ncbi:MAG TPA: sugar ABC transporter permease, partial [Halanaerobiales bacterium]|nr:sugar ABC transporter permease [Halanaerobiales bacterium]
FIAMILRKRFKGVNFFRSLSYLPSLLGASVAVSAMWSQLFGTRGLVNSILNVFGVRGSNWIANPSTALYVLVILAIWQFGSSMIVFLSGLNNIPVSLYESCQVDGGGLVKQFFYITLPMLSPVILFNFILQTITVFQVFTQAFIITRGGPMGETNFMVLYIYDKAFTGSQMGYASAMSWALLLLIAVVTGLIFWSSKYWVYYES